MSDYGTFWLPPASSTYAGEVDGLFYFIYWVSVVSFFLLVGATFWFAWNYRKREGGPKVEQFIHGPLLELAWSGIPALILLLIFVWGLKGFMTMQVAPRGAMEVHVTAKKWSWTFDYPNGKSSTGELHVPYGQPVKLIMRSEDVLHSFYVPEFRMKGDVLPGRYNAVWFESTNMSDDRVEKMGVWGRATAEKRAELEDTTVQIFCTEYCGKDHSYMLAKLVVHNPDSWKEWYAADPDKAVEGLPLAQVGEITFKEQGCTACHSVDGSKLVGPSFKGIWGRQEQLTDGSTVTVDENYVRRSIREPAAQVVATYAPVMPPYLEKNVSDKRIDGLIEYFKTLQ